MKFLKTIASLSLILLLLFGSMPLAAKGAAGVVEYDLHIVNGLIIDGTGRPGFRGDVLVRGDRIELITRGTALRAAEPVCGRRQARHYQRPFRRA